MLAIRVSANSEQSSGQPKHPICHVNMYNWKKLPSPCKGGQRSNCDERRIPIPRHENKLVPGRGPEISVFMRGGKKLKYNVKESNHTPGTLRAIPSGVLNRLAKLTSRKPSLHSEGGDKIYPDHTNALRKAVLAPYNLLTMVDLWRKQDEKVDMEKEPGVNKRKNINVYFCVAYSRYFSTSIHRVINRLKMYFNLS